jgi:hypothetical protein
VTLVAAAARVEAVTLATLGVVCAAICTPAAGLAVEVSDEVFAVKVVFV